MGDPTETFYAELPEVAQFEEVIASATLAQAPSSWHVVITDVQGSTKAIEEGRYKDVNALGVTSIIAVKNALADLELPYVFGGDGATILVPGSRLADVDVALRGMRRVAEEAYDLALRTARVPIAELLSKGHPLLVGRHRMSENVALAVFKGKGMSVAEEWVKDPTLGQEFAVPAEGDAFADLEGFECRWEPAPSRKGHMMSLLVVAVSEDAEERERCYAQTLKTLGRLGLSGNAPPFGESEMRLRSLSGDFSTEAKARSGHSEGPRYAVAKARAKGVTLVGRALVTMGVTAGTFRGSKYKQEVLENTDFRKFDEALRMVLDVSPDELANLRAYLEQERSAERLVYGIHLSDGALITCMIKSYRGDHVHFVDGADGGYALAAKQLKAQLKAKADRSQGHG